MPVNRFTFPTLFLFLFFTQPAFLVAQTVVVDAVYLIVNSQMATRSIALETSAALKAKATEQGQDGKSHGEKLLMSMVQEMLLLDRASALKISPSENEVESRLNKVVKSQPQLLDIYSESQLQEQLVRDFKKQYVIGREVDSKIRIEDNEIELFCQKERRKNRKVGLAQILLKGNETEIQTQEKQIRSEFSQGVAFDDLAKQYSVDPNATSNGGKLGIFKPEDLLAEIGEVAKNLGKGEMSQLVQTAIGSHLLYVYEEQFAPGMDCSDLKSEQKNRFSNGLFQQKRNALLTKYMDELFACAHIDVKAPGDSGLPDATSLPQVDRSGINCQARQVRVMEQKKENKSKSQRKRN